MKRFIEGEDRQQVTLLPECLDDYIAEDNPVRVVDAFVEELDLQALGFEGVEPAATGRPVVPPGGAAEDLHLRLPQPHPVQPPPGARGAAQRRADVAHRPAGAGLQDHRRLPSRQRQPASATSAAASSCLCRELKLFSQAIVAIDGSKFKAVNSRDRNFTPGKIDARQRQIEQSIQRYLDALETADRTQPAEVEAKTERLQDKIKKLREQMRRTGSDQGAAEARARRAALAHRSRCALDDTRRPRARAWWATTCRRPSTPSTT